MGKWEDCLVIIYAHCEGVHVCARASSSHYIMISIEIHEEAVIMATIISSETLRSLSRWTEWVSGHPSHVWYVVGNAILQ